MADNTSDDQIAGAETLEEEVTDEPREEAAEGELPEDFETLTSPEQVVEAMLAADSAQAQEIINEIGAPTIAGAILYAEQHADAETVSALQNIALEQSGYSVELANLLDMGEDAEKTAISDLENSLKETQDINEQGQIIEQAVEEYENEKAKNSRIQSYDTFERILATSQVRKGLAQVGLPFVCKLVAKIKTEHPQNDLVRCSYIAQKAVDVYNLAIEDLLELDTAEIETLAAAEVQEEDEQA